MFLFVSGLSSRELATAPLTVTQRVGEGRQGLSDAQGEPRGALNRLRLLGPCWDPVHSLFLISGSLNG